MHPEPDPRIIDFLLGEMSPAERMAFEREMATNPQLKAEVSQWESSLARGFTHPGPPASEALWQKIEAALPAQSVAGRTWRQPVWLIPAAALLVFALLISILLISSPRETARNGSHYASADAEALEPLQLLAERLKLEGILNQGESLSDINPDELLARIRQAEMENATREAERRLREGEPGFYDADYQALVEQQTMLAEAYETLSDRYLSLFDKHPGMARFTVIELVDANTFASNGPRMGLAELARQFLMNDAQYEGHDPLYGPGLESGQGMTLSTLAAATRWSSTPDAPNAGDPGVIDFFNGTTGEQPPGGSTPDTPGERENYIPVGMDDTPFAFTVWSEDDQKGFMDIHNLPPVPAGESATLWVRAAGTDEYLLIGIVPDFENGTGSLFYSIEEPDFSPGEVIITIESNPQATQPGTRILLRGP
jgi:hypothetical protein